ncbi:hypothetical protein B0H11DRAFT_588204 [Mycena galericulata]|nr:hypothetical protein B0H11DRAFT_588204 [Mycena galericulata]
MFSHLFSWTPIPYAYLTLYLTILITSLATRPCPQRRLFFLPLLALTWRLLHDAQAGYITSMYWFTSLIMASDYLLLTDVQRELRQIHDSSDRRASRPIQNIEHAPFLERVNWAVHLFFNARGVGWAHEPRKALPSRAAPNTPRVKFIAEQTLRLGATLVLFDLVNLHVRWNPALGLRLGLASVGWTWRVIGTVGWAAGAFAGLASVHYTSSIVCVALGISLPQDWPPLFGRIADAASVRTFWARGWHQLLRRSLCAHGQFVSGTLMRLSPGSTASSCVQIVVAFLLSASSTASARPLPWASSAADPSSSSGSSPPASRAKCSLRDCAARRVVASTLGEQGPRMRVGACVVYADAPDYAGPADTGGRVGFEGGC